MPFDDATSQSCERLTVEQRQEIDEALQIAATASHAELAQVCGQLMSRFEVSYQELRALTDAPLPDYLAVASGRPEATRPGRAPKANKLTAEQSTAVISAYREASATNKRAAALRSCVNRFSEQFGVKASVIQAALTADERAHSRAYLALRDAAKQKRAAATREAADKKRHQQLMKRLPAGMTLAHYVGVATHCPVCGVDVGSNVTPQHGPKPYGCRGSGRLASTLYAIDQARREAAQSSSSRNSGGSVHTVSGGLPGLGRRS